MLVRRHSQTTPTPKIPAAIQARVEPALVLADRHATTEQAVWKWRKRDSVKHRSPPPSSSDHPDHSPTGCGGDALRKT